MLVLIIVPNQHQSFGYVFSDTVNASGYGSPTDNFSNPAFWFVFALGMLLSQYTITGFDASAHHGGGDACGVPDGRHRDVHVGGGLGVRPILLLAVTFAVPSTAFALENIGTIVPSIWTESMSQNWSEVLFICVVAQFFCLTASVTSASMMFAFSRDRAVPGHQLWRRVARNRVPRYAVWAIMVLSALLMVPAIWNYLVGYAAGTAIAVIGLYIAFVIPVYLRFRLGDRFGDRSLEPRPPLQVDRHRVAALGGPDHDPLRVPPVESGLPWEPDFSWELTNYTIPWFGGIGLFFGGLVVHLRQELVQGPARWAPRRSSSGWRKSSSGSSSCRPRQARRTRSGSDPLPGSDPSAS